jgi:integrase/recombinase XerD
MPVTHVSKLMGHSNLQVTMGYAKIVNKDLEDAMEVFN